jgi:outer membrane protein assembly factor BamB
MGKILRYAGLSAGLAVVTLGILWAFFGLRFQMDGTGMRPMVYFDRTEKVQAELEQRSQAEGSVKIQEAAAELPSEAPPPAPETPQAASAGVPPVVETASWPAFYGPQANGHYTETPILTAWPAQGLPEAWRRPVGGGYASMIVAGNRIFTIEQRRSREATAAYDLATGKELWVNEWPADFREAMGGDGPRATPTYYEGRVYALGAEGEFRCLDAASGRTIWRKNILEDNGATNLQWGMAASPLVVDDLVIVLPGGRSGKSVAAYHRITGARQWTALDDKAAYAAPMVATLQGRRQLVIVTASRMLGLTLDGKQVLWEFPWVTEYDVNSTMPVVVDNEHVLISSGYGHGAALVRITPGGAEEVWKSQAMKAKFNNVVLKDGVVYGLDEGILAAMDARTGQRKWKGGRYGYGQILLAGDHIVVSTEQGDVALVKANPEKHEEVARFTALEGKTWNVPALAAGLLLVRNQTEMACYRIAP